MIEAQELSDRFEIQDLLANYCHAIDTQDFNVLDEIFTEDAIVDYTAVGGAKGNLRETKAYLERALEKFTGMQHMMGLPQIKIGGDTASVRTICFNPMVIDRECQPHVFFVGIWYVDKLVRTDGGWRIEHRAEEFSYFHNFPNDFTPADPDK